MSKIFSDFVYLLECRKSISRTICTILTLSRAKEPLLYHYAKGINSMVCSSASSERIWSIFSFIHTKLRNRLSSEKVDKLAFLYVNSAFLDEKDREDYVLNEYVGLCAEDFDDFDE